MTERPFELLDRNPVMARLSAMYQAQLREDMILGSSIFARAGLPVAANTPTITRNSITQQPQNDADAAAQVIYPFGQDDLSVDPVPKARLSKRYISCFSEALRARGYGMSLRLSCALDSYAANSSQDQDAALNYGIQSGATRCSFVLDGDVLFLRTQNGTQSAFELYVEGSLCIVSPGSGVVTTSDGRGYAPDGDGYIKIKFPTVATRRLTFINTNNLTFSAFFLRAIHTLTPISSTPIKWAHLGDSFSAYTGNGASARTLSLVEWLIRSFGLENIDFINGGNGASSFANALDLKPNETPVANRKAAIRTQYMLNIRGCAPDIVTMLVGHNEESDTLPLVATELTATIAQIYSEFPRCIVAIFAGNASPPNIGTLINNIEVTMQNVCALFPRVLFFPLQTYSGGAFLRGTGRVGNTTGVGNSDLYTGPDGVHPSDAGHRAYGLHMARRLYDSFSSIN